MRECGGCCGCKQRALQLGLTLGTVSRVTVVASCGAGLKWLAGGREGGVKVGAPLGGEQAC